MDVLDKIGFLPCVEWTDGVGNGARGNKQNKVESRIRSRVPPVKKRTSANAWDAPKKCCFELFEGNARYSGLIVK